MISASGLTKQYGAVRAVDDLSFDAKPGVVTGFLGPNGAGKTTTMRMILGLDRPTAGHVTVNGRPYRGASAPMREVGALIDPTALQTGRTARQHLRWLAEAGAMSGARVAEVLDEVELGHAADRRISGFSLGMCQRLGLAAALLGDPATLILDEPANGLDPAGIRWMRDLLRMLAAEGRTVFVSSHQLGEIQQTVDRVVVIDRGRLVVAVDIDDVGAETERVTVRTPQSQALLAVLREHGITVDEPSSGAGSLIVIGVPAATIGDIAAEQGIPLHELSRPEASLENVFLSLTKREDVADGEGRS
ncbi:ABC transporter ATP-binding protein [Brevibacterium pigmentatum]|uniref:ABC transporter ATP-binding protein n=1 Tax=Brevibacterium pigmentatum TaxID=1496080 RepID=UPI00141E59FE|nr:ATP-binding cassette domain-containing protein [Brevibacterium pigmentatum]